jgi:NADPH:quinone reductase-like Zn-dependent oxidoreductase
MAVNAGAHVIATARNQDRFQELEALGARRVEIEGPDLSERIPEGKRIDAVLDLVGTARSWIPSPCCDEVGARAWRAF